MTEPPCGFGPDNKYCSVLWNEHAATEMLMKQHLAAKKRVLEALHKFFQDLSWTAPELLQQRGEEELAIIIDHAFDGIPKHARLHVEGTVTGRPHPSEPLGANDEETQ
jgi:hypothetical protein